MNNTKKQLPSISELIDFYDGEENYQKQMNASAKLVQEIRENYGVTAYTYEEYLKKINDPARIAKEVEKYGSYKEYQKALKEDRKKKNRIMCKVRIWHYGRMLIRIIIPMLISVALFYVFFFM